MWNLNPQPFSYQLKFIIGFKIPIKVQLKGTYIKNTLMNEVRRK